MRSFNALIFTWPEIRRVISEEMGSITSLFWWWTLRTGRVRPTAGSSFFLNRDTSVSIRKTLLAWLEPTVQLLQSEKPRTAIGPPALRLPNLWQIWLLLHYGLVDNLASGSYYQRHRRFLDQSSDSGDLFFQVGYLVSDLRQTRVSLMHHRSRRWCRRSRCQTRCGRVHATWCLHSWW